MSIKASRALVLTAIISTVSSSAARAQPKGEQDRTYTFPGTSEAIAYHLFVPST